MADFTRLQYFHRQLLEVADFKVEQNYHQEMRRLHNRRLHTWGVVDGLTVSAKDDKTVTIQPGMAMDASGREMEASSAVDKPVPADLGNALYMIIQHVEVDTELADGDPNHFKRTVEKFDIQLLPQEKLINGVTVILSRITLEAGKIKTLDDGEAPHRRRRSGINSGSGHFSRDGMGECCSSGDFTLSVAEDTRNADQTARTGRRATIQFHNHREAEGFIRLAALPGSQPKKADGTAVAGSQDIATRRFIFGSHQQEMAGEFTGDLYVNGNARIGNELHFGTAGARLTPDQGGSLELGPKNSSKGEVPYIDFHFGKGIAQDYNTRIMNGADNRLDFITRSSGIALSIKDDLVGLGTPAPLHLLHLYKDSAEAVLCVHTKNSGNPKLQLLSEGNQLYEFRADRALNRLIIARPGVTGDMMAFDPNTGNVGIGTTGPGKNLHIHGLSSAPFINDGDDRPGLAITGNYPELDLFSGMNNTSHGPTIRLGAYNDDQKNAFKHWVIGTAGRDARFLDLGFAENNTNPHAGIRDWGGGRTVLTLVKDSNRDGYVGIGKIDPQFRLHVSGTGEVSDGPQTIRLGTRADSVLDVDFALNKRGMTIHGNDPKNKPALLQAWSSDGVHWLNRLHLGYEGSLEISDRMRIKSGVSGTAGMWLHQSGIGDRAFVGMVDNDQAGFWGNTGAGWGLIMNTANGNVGIGTAPSADTKLRINNPGGGRFLINDSPSGAEWSALGYYKDGQAKWDNGVRQYGKHWYVWSSAAGIAQSIDHATGNVGIGKDPNPAVKLDVAGTVQAATFVGNGAVPRGVIAMWSGAANNIPAGWALCDGENSTPNLKDRFIVGAGGAYGVGSSGGEASVVLAVDQMPAHTHEYEDVYFMENKGWVDVGDKLGSKSSDADNLGYEFRRISYSTGGSKAHENRPPYYALCFIMKL